MNHKDKLLDFIDGNLNLEEEQTLFSELSYNDSLRDDLKSYIAIDKSIKANPTAFAPSSAATNKVFAALGYTLPAENVVAAPPAKGGFSIGKIFTGITGGIAGALLTLAAVSFFLDSGEPVRESVVMIKNFPQIEATGLAISESVGGPVSENAKKKDASVITSEVRSPLVQMAPAAHEAENENIQPVKTSNREDLSFSSIGHSAHQSNFFNKEGINLSKTRTMPMPVNAVLPKMNYSSGSGLSFEVKNHEAWHLPEQTITPMEVPLFNHTGISLLYGITDELELGASVRRENFYLEYKGFEDNTEYQYYQQPNFVSYAMLTRYALADLYPINPFVQIELGGNKYGYIVRPTIGASMHIYQDVSFVVNLETGLFFFNNDNKWFTAQKIGFEYGIKYTF